MSTIVATSSRQVGAGGSSRIVLASPRSHHKEEKFDLKSTEDVRRARQDLFKSLKRVQIHNGDTTLHDVSLALCQAMNELQRRLDAAEERMRESEQETKEVLKGQEKQISERKEVETYLYDAICDLALQSRLLEGFALGYRPFVGALAVRKQLDRARYYIAAAFMRVYPQRFPQNETLNQYDPANMTVAWRLFKRNLGKLFDTYHKKFWISEKVYELKQWYSCLDIDREEKDAIDGDSGDGRSDRSFDSQLSIQSPYDDSELLASFSPRHIGYCNEDGYLDMSNDEFLQYELNFFLPAIIWEFNKVKKQLIDVDAKIYTWRTSVQDNESALQDLKPDATISEPGELMPPENSTRFQHGTALDVRMSEAWKDCYLEFLSAPTHRASPPVEPGFPPEGIAAPQAFPSSQRGQRRKREDIDDGNDEDDEGHVIARFITETDEGNLCAVARSGASIAGSDRPISSSSRAGRSLKLTASAGAVRESTRPGPISPIPPSASGPRGKNSTLIIAVEAQLSMAKQKVANYRSKRESLLKKFDCFRRFFDVVFDEELVKWAILEESILRQLTNDYAHINDENDQAVADDNLQRVNELFIHARREHDLPTNTDLRGLLRKISDIATSHTSYYDDKESSVESSVDQYIAATASSRINDAINDYQILLARMESLKPVVDLSPG